MKFGFEREFFVVNPEGKFVIATSLPHDDCGYLAEVRSEPHIDPRKALGLYRAEEDHVRILAKQQGLELILLDWAKLDKKFKSSCLRQFGKNASIDEGSMYGKFWSGEISRAGLHVHFSNEIKVKDGNYERVIPSIIDMPRFIFGLDKIFAKEIKEAKRVPGLYEMKVHGFEYRSLPASIDMDKVVDALYSLMNKRWTSVA